MTGFKKTLLDKHLVRGSVWKALQIFPKSSPRIKYWIVLVDDDNDILYLLPTSKGAYFKRTKNISFVQIQKGSCEFFEKTTYVSCDQIYREKSEIVLSLFGQQKIDYIGQLPKELMIAIDKKLEASRVLSPHEKSILFGD